MGYNTFSISKDKHYKPMKGWSWRPFMSWFVDGPIDFTPYDLTDLEEKREIENLLFMTFEGGWLSK